MKDILFDEKIAGSVHLTPGQAYKEAWNGNSSQVHWDLVLRMDPASGGGEVWFDDRLVRKDDEMGFTFLVQEHLRDQAEAGLETLDRAYLPPLTGHCIGNARAHRFAIEQHGARSAIRGVAPDYGADLS